MKANILLTALLVATFSNLSLAQTSQGEGPGNSSIDETIRSVECTINKGFVNAGQKIQMFQTDKNDNKGMTIGGAKFLDLGKLVVGEKLVAMGMSNLGGLYTNNYQSPSNETIKATVMSDRSWGDTARDKKFNIKVIISGPTATLLGSYHTYLEAKCKRLQAGFYFKL